MENKKERIKHTHTRYYQNKQYSTKMPEQQPIKQCPVCGTELEGDYCPTCDDVVSL
ncbi:MAG: hypothetical protein ACTSWC_11035 [Promethearchaeota archaeon]